MIVDEPTPCFNKSWMFDSTNPADAMAARMLCAGCPVRRQCAAEYKSMPPAWRSEAEGTWAGETKTPRTVAKVKAPPCGTERGYRFHRRRKEDPCDACIAGAANARANQRAKRNGDEAA